MKTTGKSPACLIEARFRLWMLAVVGVVFSFVWPLVDALTHQYSFVRQPASTPLAAHDALSRHVLRMMPATVTARTMRPTRDSAAVPVGFHIADLNVPRNSDRIFSYRQIDEFLQHQARLTAGTQHEQQGKNSRKVDDEQQRADVQSF